jgi:hypothetical protein
MSKKAGFWLFIALSLPVVAGCNKADPKASERDAEVQKLRAELRAEVADREWEIAALKAKLGDPGVEAAKTRDLLIGKWAPSKTKGMTLEFTRDGTLEQTRKGEAGGDVLGGVGPDSSIIGGKYIWLDDGHIGLARKGNAEGNLIREKHKVVVTKDDLTLTDRDGHLENYKRVN